MMKQNYTTWMLAIAILAGQTLYAQIDPPCMIPGAALCDNLDAYTVDEELGPQSSWWSTWDGTEGDGSDALVTDEFAFSGTNSMLIPEGSIVDVILLLGNQTSGVWRLRWMMYVPDEKTAYYNFQESETPGVAWNMEALFGLYDYTTPAPSGEGTVTIPEIYDFNYPTDQWFMVDHMIDLDGNEIEMYIDGEFVFSSVYAGNLGAVNFYSIDANNRFYIDDVLFIDNALLNTFFADLDEDGFGDAGNSILIVGDPPPGYVADNTDCNDSNSDIYPGASEVCNELDDNCNGDTDEGVLTTYYVDADGDSFGDADATVEACDLTAGLSENSADCDDTDENIYPGATEIANGLDDDCDDAIDENVAVIDRAFDNMISIFPNPASAYFIIELPAMNEQLSVNMFNISGKMIYFNSVYSISGSQLVIETDHLAPGIYQIEIVSGDKIAMKQIAIE